MDELCFELALEVIKAYYLGPADQFSLEEDPHGNGDGSRDHGHP